MAAPTSTLNRDILRLAVPALGALMAEPLFLIVDSAVGLVTAEHPSIGSVQLFGRVFWLGWLMMAVMVLTGVPPVLLGRVKIKLARELHDKVLYADAKMNKADWMTAFASLIGVAGIGIGWWWTRGGRPVHLAVDPVRRGPEPALVDPRPD